MARKRLVTRTIKSDEVTVLCLNIETAEPENLEAIITPPEKDPRKELERLHDMLDTETVKVVAVVDRVAVEKRYGMTEADFIKNSVELTADEADENEQEDN